MLITLQTTFPLILSKRPSLYFKWWRPLRLLLCFPSMQAFRRLQKICQFSPSQTWNVWYPITNLNKGWKTILLLFRVFQLARLWSAQELGVQSRQLRLPFFVGMSCEPWNQFPLGQKLFPTIIDSFHWPIKPKEVSF